MKFALFRHAQKGILPFEDPELTHDGHLQSSKLPLLIQKKILPPPTQLWISPKRRTAQTFYALAKDYQLELKTISALDQRNEYETSELFRKRVSDFLNSLSLSYAEPEVIYACTHYDFIEEAMSLINSDKNLSSFEFSHWAPGQYLMFSIEVDCWKLLTRGTINELNPN